jgi:hypothetical protein
MLLVQTRDRTNWLTDYFADGMTALLPLCNNGLHAQYKLYWFIWRLLCVVLFSLIEVTFTKGLVTSIRRIDVSFICPPDGDSKYPSSLIHLHAPDFMVSCPRRQQCSFNCSVLQSSHCIHSFQWFSHMIGSTYFSSVLHFPISCLVSISQQIYLSQAISSTDEVAVLKWVWRNTGWSEVVIMYLFNQVQ